MSAFYFIDTLGGVWLWFVIVEKRLGYLLIGDVCCRRISKKRFDFMKTDVSLSYYHSM